MADRAGQLTGSVHVAPSTDDLFDDLAATMMAAAKDAVGQRGVFHVALSGGSTPEPFYMRLVTDPRYRFMPWRETHVWIVDERRVPESDDRSNMRMIRQTLTDHVHVRSRHVHRVPTEAQDPAADYERELLEELKPANGQPPRMDFVLLGMGDDAHTASLFPGSDALRIENHWIANNEGPAVTPPPRVTMTYPLLNASRAIAVLAVGEKKAGTLTRVAAQLSTGKPDVQSFPITGINPQATDANATMRWYLDEPAASQLSG